MDKKICPLTLIKGTDKYSSANNSIPCYQEKCAWWCGTTKLVKDKPIETGECAIKKLAIKSFSIVR